MTLKIPAFAVVVALGPAAAAQTTTVLLSASLPDTPVAGARLFVQKRCIRCHSLDSRSSVLRSTRPRWPSSSRSSRCTATT